MAALAPRYARALAEAAEAAHLDASVAAGQLREFAEVLAESRNLREVLDNPSIERAAKLRVIDSIASRLGLYAQVRNFIAVTVEHHRLNQLGEILVEYKRIADVQAASVEAEVTSARPLSAADRANLEVEITKLAGARVIARYSEDASLLGGAIIQLGSTLYDGSLRRQLAQLRQSMENA